MPTIRTTVSCPVHDSFRVQQIAGMFDVPLAEKATEHFEADVPGPKMFFIPKTFFIFSVRQDVALQDNAQLIVNGDQPLSARYINCTRATPPAKGAEAEHDDASDGDQGEDDAVLGHRLTLLALVVVLDPLNGELEHLTEPFWSGCGLREGGEHAFVQRGDVLSEQLVDDDHRAGDHDEYERVLGHRLAAVVLEPPYDRVVLTTSLHARLCVRGADAC